MRKQIIDLYKRFKKLDESIVIKEEAELKKEEEIEVTLEKLAVEAEQEPS
jgi:hypothetical protein